MKKFLLAAVLLISTAALAHAQNVAADFTNLDKLVAKLEKALSKEPKPSGEGTIDKFIDGNKTAAVGAVATAGTLHDLYSRQIGETKDGVQDVTINKPTLDDWVQLAATVATQTAGMAELGIAGKEAAEKLKSIDKMKALKIGKSLKWGTDIMPVTGEALAEEAKAINEIIKVLKSQNNL